MGRSGPAPHVLLTADAVGGVWTFAVDLARGLARAGWGVTLAVLGPPPGEDQREEAASVPGLALLTPDLSLDWTAGSAAEILRSGTGLAEIAAAAGADLVHLHGPAFAAAGPFRVPTVATSHSCVATWWKAVRGGPLPGDFAWRADLVGRGCRAVDALAAPSRAFALATQAAYGLARPPVVIHNGRAAGRAPAPEAGDAAPFAFTAGRLWDEGKNLAVLDAATPDCGMPVLAAGPLEGPNGARIALNAAQALGRLRPDEVEARLARRPVFVSTALYEPFGLSVLEAALAGCPLVLSDIPTFRELWDGAALFVPPRDPAALAATLRRLGSSPAERRRLGERAAARAARYGLDRFVAETLGLYRSVLAGTSAEAGRGAGRQRAVA